MLSLLMTNQSHMLQNFLVLCLFDPDLYVDIASMYCLHIEIDHSLWPVAYRQYIVKIAKVQEWVLEAVKKGKNGMGFKSRTNSPHFFATSHSCRLIRD